jgi:Zn-dependent protease/predicted transcriptional regulator
MPASLRLGRIAGIPLRVHITFVLLLAWIAFTSMLSGIGPTATLEGVLLVLGVFACIVVHELGHALLARRYGIATREILLLPIGGVASLERIPEKPRQELAVALVGPAISLVLALLLWPFAFRLAVINLALAIFNLIPAFPMDGGRALRALLAMRLGHTRATVIAARLGIAIAIVFAVIGLFANVWLVLIAAAIWLGARHEAAMVQVRSTLVDVPVGDAMNRHVDVVSLDDRLGDAAQRLVQTGQSQMPIIDHGVPVGVLTRNDVANGIKHAGETATIADVRFHDAITVAPNDRLEGVFDKLAHEPDAIAVVVDHGVAVGVLTAEQLATYAALHAQHPTAPR